MAKNEKIYTCYGCPSYYTEEGDRYSTKHCGEDHFKCPYYLGDGLPLIFKGEKTTIGFLRKGDIFWFERRKYRVGSLIENTNGYVACVDVETKRVKRLYIDTTVEVEKE